MSDVSSSRASDEKLLDQSHSRSAAAAAAAVTQQLKMPLSSAGAYNVDGVLSENCNSSKIIIPSEPTEDAVTGTAAGSQTRCWASDGFVSKRPADTASDHSQSLSVGDPLTSVDNDCDESLVTSCSNRQLAVVSGSDLPSVNDATRCEPACQCCLDNNESLSAASEPSKLFSCRECSITCSKHFAHDSLHITLEVVRSSDVDCSVFGDASLTVVKNEIYLIKVIKCQIVPCTFFVLQLY